MKKKSFFGPITVFYPQSGLIYSITEFQAFSAIFYFFSNYWENVIFMEGTEEGGMELHIDHIFITGMDFLIFGS